MIANNCDFLVVDFKVKNPEIIVNSSIPKPIVSGHIDGILLFIVFIL
jgi:hypothetical protein